MKVLKNKKVLILLLTILNLSNCIKKDSGIINKFYNYPNPFGPSECSETTTFKSVFNSDIQTSIGSFKYKLTIFVNGSENKVYESDFTTVNVGGAMSEFEFAWNGKSNPVNNEAKKVGGGVYTSIFAMKILTDESGNSTEAEYSSKTTTVIGACP